MSDETVIWKYSKCLYCKKDGMRYYFHRSGMRKHRKN